MSLGLVVENRRVRVRVMGCKVRMREAEARAVRNIFENVTSCFSDFLVLAGADGISAGPLLSLPWSMAT